MTSFRLLLRQQAELNARLTESTAVDPALVENVIQYSKHLVKPGTTEITINVFASQMMTQFHITNQNMIYQMFDALSRRRKTTVVREMTMASKTVALEDYSWCLCMFLSNNLNLKVDWVFSVYDTNGDGELSKLELYILLKPCVIHSEDMDTEEAVKELVDIVISVFDMDKSGTIDLEEFRSLVKKNVLYIDLLGQCLPSEHHINVFSKKIEKKTSVQIAEVFEADKRRASVASLPEPSDSFYPITLEMP